MKIFMLAFLAGIGYKTGEFLLDYLYCLIPRKKKRNNNKVSYSHYYDR